MASKPTESEGKDEVCLRCMCTLSYLIYIHLPTYKRTASASSIASSCKYEMVGHTKDEDSSAHQTPCYSL